MVMCKRLLARGMNYIPTWTVAIGGALEIWACLVKNYLEMHPVWLNLPCAAVHVTSGSLELPKEPLGPRLPYALSRGLGPPQRPSPDGVKGFSIQGLNLSLRVQGPK